MGLWALVGVICAIVFMAGGDAVSGQGTTCGMQLNQGPLVFCETFDQPSPVFNRSGQLNGTLWGVSRLLGGATGITTFKNSTLDGCNGPQAASPVGATDVIICNGQLRESVDDNTDVSVLALYAKQPFDFANRTGTVAFDVSNGAGPSCAPHPMRSVLSPSQRLRHPVCRRSWIVRYWLAGGFGGRLPQLRRRGSEYF
jgi:hypothetical protein